MSNQTVAVRYFSKSGNTAKLAVRIADVTGCIAKTVEHPVNDKADLLFLGASVYWGGIDNQVKEFIKSLDAGKVGKVAVFSTSALAERAYPEIKKLLADRGIAVVKENFYCKGQFKVMHRGKPDAKELMEVQQFAKALWNDNNSQEDVCG